MSSSNEEVLAQCRRCGANFTIELEPVNKQSAQVRLLDTAAQPHYFRVLANASYRFTLSGSSLLHVAAPHVGGQRCAGPLALFATGSRRVAPRSIRSSEFDDNGEIYLYEADAAAS